MKRKQHRPRTGIDEIIYLFHCYYDFIGVFVRRAWLLLAIIARIAYRCRILLLMCRVDVVCHPC